MLEDKIQFFFKLNSSSWTLQHGAVSINLTDKKIDAAYKWTTPTTTPH